MLLVSLRVAEGTEWVLVGRLHTAATAAAVLVILAATLAVTGCNATYRVNSHAASPDAWKLAAHEPSPAAEALAAETDTPQASTAPVEECLANGPAPMVSGTVNIESGFQWVRIGIKNGHYSPNVFTVNAETPVRVVFVGNAKGCLTTPTFPALGKKADLSSARTATVDLGKLRPGDYALTCANGTPNGKIIVR
jgi:hypothetical protein